MRYDQPDNEDAFEQLCLRYYRRLWSNHSLELYAKRGEKQHGVDIYDPRKSKPVRAVQCKFHEPTKTLSRREIEEEVGKAEASHFGIEEYVIVTTARRSGSTQDIVLELNSRPSEQRRFPIEIHFWDDVCRRVAEMPRMQAAIVIQGRDTAKEILAEVLFDPDVRALANAVLESAGLQPGAALASDTLEEIDRLLKDRRIDVAKHELDKQPVGDQLQELPADDRYRILRLRAIHALETAEYSTASQLFLEAFEVKSDTDQAKQNQVLGYLLGGDTERAFATASQYIDDGIVTSAMICRLIDSVPNLDRLQQLLPKAESLLALDENVNLALAHKYRELEDRVAAQEAVNRALSIAPTSAHVHFAAAIIEHGNARRDDWRNRSSHLIKAEHHYSICIETSRSEKRRTLEAEALVNRAAIHMLLCDKQAAAADYRSAVDAAIKPHEYALRAVSYFLHIQNFRAAWEFVDRLDSSTEGRFYASCVEFLNEESIDKRKSLLRDMRLVCEQANLEEVELRMHCVHCALVLKDYAQAEECVSARFRTACPFHASLGLAWISLHSQDQERALAHATDALNQDSRDAHLDDLRVLAEVLQRLKQDELAIDVLDRIATPGVLDNDTWDLIYCAQRLERHDVLFRVCREVRETGSQDERLRRMEVQLLYQYAPEQGLEVADELIRASSSKGYFTAYKNALAVRLEVPELVQLDPSRLPLPEELPVDESRIVTLPYVELRRFDEALRFLYAQLRHYFEDEDAHGQYIYYFLTYADKCASRQRIESVQRDSAVLIEADAGSSRWIVIENQNPVATRGEFAEESEFARKLLGRGVGDVVELPSAFTGQSVTVRAIQSKFTRAYQDAIEHFCDRFPETQFMQPLRFGEGENFNVEPIIETLKGRREHVERCLKLYREYPCSLYLLANRVGLNLLETVLALGQRPGATVKCAQCTPEEFAEAAASEARSAPFVLDLSAIVTLSLTDSWHLLEGSGDYFVSRTTRETLGHWVSHVEEFSGRESGYATISDGDQLLFTETTEEQIETKLAKFRCMASAADERCEVRSAASVAAIRSSKRDLYKEAFGFANVESMCLAKDLAATLWTDDAAVALLSKGEMGVESVWTQLALRRFANRDVLSEDSYELVSAKLVAMSYGTLIWSAKTILAGGRAAGWSPQQQPFKKCLGLISKVDLSVYERVSIAMECISLLLRSDCPLFQKSPVIQAIFSAVGSRRTIESLAVRLEREFVRDPISIRFLQPEFRYWLDNYPG